MALLPVVCLLFLALFRQRSLDDIHTLRNVVAEIEPGMYDCLTEGNLNFGVAIIDRILRIGRIPEREFYLRSLFEDKSGHRRVVDVGQKIEPGDLEADDVDLDRTCRSIRIPET